jgi:hypothetical protein
MIGHGHRDLERHVWSRTRIAVCGCPEAALDGTPILPKSGFLLQECP